MNHYILFEFDPGCALIEESKDRLLDHISTAFYGGLPELFSAILANLHEQSWIPLESEYDYEFADCFKYDCEGLCRVLQSYGLSGRFWVTDDRYSAPPAGEFEAQERHDRNVIEFGPGVEDCYARRSAAQGEEEIQRAAQSLAYKLQTVKEWFDNGQPGDVFDLYWQLGPNLNLIENRDRFREVCRELFGKQGIR